MYQSDNHVERGRLPCPILSQESDDLSLLDVEGDSVDYVTMLVALDQIFDYYF
jgi:acyl carrier protein